MGQNVDVTQLILKIYVIFVIKEIRTLAIDIHQYRKVGADLEKDVKNHRPRNIVNDLVHQQHVSNISRYRGYHMIILDLYYSFNAGKMLAGYSTQVIKVGVSILDIE